MAKCVTYFDSNGVSGQFHTEFLIMNDYVILRMNVFLAYLQDMFKHNFFYKRERSWSKSQNPSTLGSF